MKDLEAKIDALRYNGRTPVALRELGDAQAACRIAKSSPEACPGVQRGTSNICNECRAKFFSLHQRDPLPVELSDMQVAQLMGS